MKRKNVMMMHEKYHKGEGLGMLILGLLVIANVYWMRINWAMFIGAALVIGGICKMSMCCKK